MSDAVQLILRANKLMNIEQLELVRDMVAATRANALEEAAKVVEFSPDSHTAREMQLMLDKAAAIRAMAKEVSDE